MDARERSSGPGFGREVGGERRGLDVKRRQADAAYRDAVAGAQVFRSVAGFDRDAPVLAALLNLNDFANFFNDSGKHEWLQRLRPSASANSQAPMRAEGDHR